jgi:UDP-2,3-diacylglucosamine hydrolase
MIETVFISDLHLHPHNSEIQERFNTFLGWAKKNSLKKIYILGDFFHAWAGDDSINDWSRSIAGDLNNLVQQGIELFYMHGNRDFLLGKEFAKLAGWTILPEPTIVYLGSEKILLAHGDRYCIKDKSHQWFRKLTRNSFFPWFFLKLPLQYRLGLVDKVRQISQESYKKTTEQMDVVAEAVIKHMRHWNAHILIHGHTHKPGLTTHSSNTVEFKRYVLSDWDDMPALLCYDYSKGIYFIHHY